MKLDKKAGKKLLALSLFIFTSFLSNAVSIKGTMKGISNGSKIYLYQYLTTELIKFDSTKIINGEFKFKEKQYTHGIYKLGSSEEKSIMLIISNEDLDINGDLANVTAQIGNSKENKLLEIFNIYNVKYNEDFAKLDKMAQPIIALRSTNPELFNVEIKKLQLVLDSLNKNRFTYFTNFSKENQNTFASKLASPFLVSDTVQKQNYFTKDDLEDPDMAGGDMIYNKIIMYLQKFAGQQINQLKDESNYLLSLPKNGTKNKEAFYISFIKIFAPYDPEYSKSLTTSYVKEFPKSLYAQKMLYALPKGAPRIGDIAPDIKLSNAEGKEVSLNSLKGKVVLIDFWASWCGPCRQENPNVVRVYQKFKDKGFTIYSVSLDDNKDRWIQAIQKDNLVWDHHVSDLKGWQSSAAQLYQVKGIPATFLVGRDGKIVGANLRGESLEAKLLELIK